MLFNDMITNLKTRAYQYIGSTASMSMAPCNLSPITYILYPQQEGAYNLTDNLYLTLLYFNNRYKR